MITGCTFAHHFLVQNSQSLHVLHALRNSLVLLGLLCSCLYAATTQADEPDLLRMSLQELMKIRITGSTLSDESLRSVPAAVTIFNHQQIERLGIDYLYELLNLVPGYQSQRNADNVYSYAYSSRGRRNGTQSKEILLLIDGRLMNDPVTGSANGILAKVPVALIERVEVMRGPGSALYGSNAYTGIINIVSRKNTREASIAAGRHDMYQGQLFEHTRQSDWQGDLFVSAYSDRGQRYEVLDTFSNTKLTTLDPVQTLHVDAQAAWGNTKLQLYSFSGEGDEFYYQSTVANDITHYHSYQHQLSLTHAYVWPSGLETSWFVEAQYGAYEFDSQRTAPGALAAISNPSSNEPMRGSGHTRKSMLQFKWHNSLLLENNSDLKFGLDLRREDDMFSRAKANFNFAELAAGDYPISYYGDDYHEFPFSMENHRDVIGLYSQFQKSWQQQTHLTLGVRLDDYSDSKTGSRVSPRLGLVQNLNAQNTLKLLYGEAFRAPALNESGLINNPIVIGNPDLKDEIVKTMEMIWGHQTANKSLQLGYFHNRYLNPITSLPIGSVRKFVNDANHSTQGVELEYRQQLNDNWLVSSTAARFFDLPEASIREAKTTGSLQINYEQTNWNLNLSAIYHGPRQMYTPDNTTLQLSGYWLVNSKWRYQAVSQWNLFIQIKNLLNDNYVTAPQSNLMEEGVANRERELSIGVTYRFD